MERRETTDDLDALMEALPPEIVSRLSGLANRTDLLEVVLDLGRRPEARFTTGEEDLLDREVTDADIAHGFNGTEVETNDGVIIQGLLFSDNDPLIIQSQGAAAQMIPKARVKAKRPMQRSLMMPPALLGLTAQEAADIAAYLRHGVPKP